MASVIGMVRKLLQIASVTLLVIGLLLAFHANSFRSRTPKEIELQTQWDEFYKLTRTPSQIMDLASKEMETSADQQRRGDPAYSYSYFKEMKSRFDQAHQQSLVYHEEMKLLDTEQKSITQARMKASWHYFIIAATCLLLAVASFLFSRLKLPIRIQIG